MAWWWQRLDADGQPLEAVGDEQPEEFPTRGDAESWLGEMFGELAEQGVDAVTLYEGQDKVYGPMSLSAPS